MKLSDKQKDIIKNISERKITDIISFVKHYNLGKEVCYDKAEVESKFNEIYEEKVYKCETRHFENFNQEERVVMKINGEIGLCKPKVKYEGLYYNCSHCGEQNSYHLFKPVYITKNINEIISFIALCKYLKEQALIIDLPKSCTKDDMALFLEQTTTKEREYIPLNEEHDIPYAYTDLDISYSNFFNKNYELNKDNFEICYPYLTQKIYPAPELINFIQKDFCTKEEINNRINFKIALAGVIIAIGTSIVSLCMSVLDKGYHSELDNINKSIQEIKQEISEDKQIETILDETFIEESSQETTTEEKTTNNQIE